MDMHFLTNFAIPLILVSFAQTLIISWLYLVELVQRLGPTSQIEIKMDQVKKDYLFNI